MLLFLSIDMMFSKDILLTATHRKFIAKVATSSVKMVAVFQDRQMQPARSAMFDKIC